MGEILKVLGPYLGGVIQTLVVVLAYMRSRYYQDTLKGKEGLAGVRERLARHGEWRGVYFTYLRQSLAWVDGKLGASSWSAESYDVTLRLAFLYPFASLLLIWMITGQNTSGIPNLLPHDATAWLRVEFVSGASLSTAFYFASWYASGWRLWAYLAVAFPAAVAFVSGGCFAVAVTVAGAVPVAGAVAVAGTGAVVVAVLDAQDRAQRYGRLGLFYRLYVASMLLLLATLAHYARLLNLNNELAEFFLGFLALLPLINSVFDWLSLAVTRALLRHVAGYGDTAFQIALNLALGLVLGVLLLAGLAMTITAALQVMDRLSQGGGGPELFDLAGTLHRVRADPADPAIWWVYFTLFSTLLPTLAHAAIVSGSFVTWRLPDILRRRWLGLIDDHDLKENFPVLLGLALRLTILDVIGVGLGVAAFALIVVLCVWMLPELGWGLLWLCESVARLLGATVMTGPVIST